MLVLEVIEIQDFIKNFTRRETTLRAVRVALIVAPMLILINHHDAILSRDFTGHFYIKCLLTFLVPYCVSAYSSARVYMAEGEAGAEF